MALIKCTECGNAISDKAKFCPKCGCPLSEMETNQPGTVRIKLPNDVVEGWVGLFSSRKATITDVNGKILWQGVHGSNASFEIAQPTKICINLGSWANPVMGIINPRRKYSLVQDLGVHMLATYTITEVDVIDS